MFQTNLIWETLRKTFQALAQLTLLVSNQPLEKLSAEDLTAKMLQQDQTPKLHKIKTLKKVVIKAKIILKRPKLDWEVWTCPKTKIIKSLHITFNRLITHSTPFRDRRSYTQTCSRCCMNSGRSNTCSTPRRISKEAIFNMRTSGLI